ncbi:MAG: biopolymer transporter ExbD [Planctomycetes bacterium]|nr:biopolymer transporter ExbD [Planctomycetota bacterium]
MAKVHDPEEPEGMNMTPMIDVTFQLIIFFMLVTDMANRQIELVKLPQASKAIKEPVEDPQILIVNIRKDGAVKIDGKLVFTPPPLDKPQEFKAEKLENIFVARRQSDAYRTVAGKDDQVKYPVLIRADRSAPWQWVQMIMMIATKEGGVTRVQMGAMQEQAEVKS